MFLFLNPQIYFINLSVCFPIKPIYINNIENMFGMFRVCIKALLMSVFFLYTSSVLALNILLTMLINYQFVINLFVFTQSTIGLNTSLLVHLTPRYSFFQRVYYVFMVFPNSYIKRTVIHIIR